MEKFDINPYIYNLIYDYDDFLNALKGTDVLKNKFIIHSSKVMTELLIILPTVDFDTSEDIEEILTSYIKMQREIFTC